MNSSSNLESEINKVLAAWNPFPVPEFLAVDEYRYYASQIALIGNDFEKISAYLKKVVGEDLSLGYDDNNPEHRADVEQIANRLVLIFKATSV
jgi:hypothetical protein